MQIAARAPLTSFSALLALPGVDAETARTLLDVVTFTNDKRIEGKINLNTAPQAVLRTLPAVTPGVASAIVSQQSAGFHSLGDLANVRSVDQPRLAKIADSFTVGSDTWIVRAYGRSGGVGVAVEAVVGLRDGRAQVLTWTRLSTTGHPPLVGLGRRSRASTVDAGDAVAVRVSRTTPPPLHVEWTPAWVRAVNIATARDRRGRQPVRPGADPERARAAAGRDRAARRVPEVRAPAQSGPGRPAAHPGRPARAVVPAAARPALVRLLPDGRPDRRRVPDRRRGHAGRGPASGSRPISRRRG